MNGKISFSTRFIKSKTFKIAAITALSATSIGAFAAEGDTSTLPAAAQAALDSVSGLTDSMIAWAWPVLTTILTATVGFKFLKKIVSKAT